jgi:hypothetical protein
MPPTVTVGTLTRAKESVGRDVVAFTGRIGRRPLAPGSYTATLVASASGLRSSPARLPLTIVR